MSIVENIAEEIKRKVDTTNVRVWTHFRYSAINDYYESLTTGVVDNDIISEFASDVIREFNVESYVRKTSIGDNDIYIIIELRGYYALVVIEVQEQEHALINMSVNLFESLEEANAKIRVLEGHDDEDDEFAATNELVLIEDDDEDLDMMDHEEVLDLMDDDF